jgi:hypothetical protein
MRLRRQAAAFALVFALAVPWVAAEPRLVVRGTGEHPDLSVPEMLSRAWSLLTSLWEAAAQPTTDEGPAADPLGPPTTDEGSGADPLG